MLNHLISVVEARPKNCGPMKDASTHARIKGPCGDTVQVWLRIDGGRIQKGSFMTDGCASSAHCCSVAVKLAEGMKPEDAAQLTQAQVLAAAGPVPADHQHCALLAANTIKAAINVYHNPTPKPSLWQRIKRNPCK